MALASDCQNHYASKRLWNVPSGPLGLPTQRAVVLRSAPWWLRAAPNSHPTQPTTWEADRATWRAALERFFERGRNGGPFGPHAGSWSLSAKKWGGLVCLHNGYHLCRFGV
jgi:hypothetical protein